MCHTADCMDIISLRYGASGSITCMFSIRRQRPANESPKGASDAPLQTCLRAWSGLGGCNDLFTAASALNDLVPSFSCPVFFSFYS